MNWFLDRTLALLAFACWLLAGVQPDFDEAVPAHLVFPIYIVEMILVLVLVLLMVRRNWSLFSNIVLAILTLCVAVSAIETVTNEAYGFQVGRGPFLFYTLSCWLLVWNLVQQLPNLKLSGWHGSLRDLAIPLLFMGTILVLWEGMTRGFDVPQVLLPPPSMIWDRLINSVPLLWADFQQTVLKGVLAGYAIGCLSGLAVAILVDRSPFLERGLLPVGNFVSALPIIGIAPIMVMWFGFDWPSKAAVVVAMTFFPMLVNTVAGLSATGHMERDLMRTYASGYWQTLFKLRLPAAAPFIFNALKINSTLALIGAIVAEFFGTPIVGMGFRIATEVGKLNIDLVWAEIAIAAVVGSAFYGIIALIERAVTFWHPSVRSSERA